MNHDPDASIASSLRTSTFSRPGLHSRSHSDSFLTSSHGGAYVDGILEPFVDSFHAIYAPPTPNSCTDWLLYEDPDTRQNLMVENYMGDDSDLEDSDQEFEGSVCEINQPANGAGSNGQTICDQRPDLLKNHAVSRSMIYDYLVSA